MNQQALERTVALLRPEINPGNQSFPGHYIDLIGEAGINTTGVVPKLMRSSTLSSVYERWWRPTVSRIAKGALGPSMSEERSIAHLLLALTPGETVLDVACGPGSFARDFAKTVGSEGLVVGLDSSRAMLERALEQRPAPNLAFIHANAVDLPFKDASFNAVSCYAALHLFDDPSNALDQMRRVLIPGGRIAIFATAAGRTGALQKLQDVVGRSSGMKIFGQDELKHELLTRGFTEIRQRLAGWMQFIGGRLPETRS